MVIVYKNWLQRMLSWGLSILIEQIAKVTKNKTDMISVSGADLEGAHPARAPLFALLCKTKNKWICAIPPVQFDNLYCLRPQVQYCLDPRMWVLNINGLYFICLRNLLIKGLTTLDYFLIFLPLIIAFSIIYLMRKLNYGS